MVETDVQLKTTFVYFCFCLGKYLMLLTEKEKNTRVGMS